MKSWITAGIRIPILFTGQKGTIESARLSEKIARTKYDHEINVLHHRFHILTEEYLKYLHSIEYYERSALRQADLIIVQADKSYKAGEIDYMDYIQNLRQALDIRNSYLETVDAFNQSVISIEFLLKKVN